MLRNRRQEFVLDFSEVKRNLARLSHVVMPAKIRAGLMGAGNALMVDTVIGLPSTPIKRPGYSVMSGRQAGELRASGALFVDGVKKRDTRHYGESATGKYQPVAYGGTPILPGMHEACVVFNAPYAAKQHEAFPNKSEPTAGMKYLSDKLYRNSEKYTRILVEAVKL